jgi:regulator of chromosome condensation
MAPTKRPAGKAGDLQKKRRLAKEFVAFTGKPGHCFTFGESLFGALGHGEDVTERRTALQVDVAEQQVLAIASGDMHSVAITEDGSVYTWGVNDEGALGRPTDGDAWNSTANGERENSCVPGKARMPEGVFTVQVVAGGGFTFALTDTGAVYGWGLFKDEVLDSDAKQFCGGTKLQRLPTLIYQPEDLRDRIIKLAAGEQQRQMPDGCARARAGEVGGLHHPAQTAVAGMGRCE